MLTLSPSALHHIQRQRGPAATETAGHPEPWYLPLGHLQNRFPASALEPNSFAYDYLSHPNPRALWIDGRSAAEVQVKKRQKDHKGLKLGHQVLLKMELPRIEFYLWSSSAAPAEDRISVDDLVGYSLPVSNLQATVDNHQWDISTHKSAGKSDAFIEL